MYLNKVKTFEWKENEKCLTCLNKVLAESLKYLIVLSVCYLSSPLKAQIFFFGGDRCDKLKPSSPIKSKYLSLKIHYCSFQIIKKRKEEEKEMKVSGDRSSFIFFF